MRAIVQERYGSAADLLRREVAEPTVGEGEVLVRVRAASVHPDVWHVVTGRPFVLRLMGAGVRRPKNPIPGTDVAGVVAQVGRGVTRFRAGDEVFGETSTPNAWANGGAYAELVSVPEACLEQKPTNVTFEQAASVPASGYITLSNLPPPDLLREGSEVLVNGAGGGVGSLALQITKARGARVTAVDSTGKLEMLRSLGADRVIDFTREDFTRGQRRYDYIFDVPGNHPYAACQRVLTEKGRYILIGHEGFGRSGRRIFGLIPQFLVLMTRARFDPHLGSGLDAMPTRPVVMSELRELLEAGKITPVVDSTFPLEQVREAFRHMMEDELLGKVILTP